MLWHTFFTGTEADVNIANSKIDQNLGLPFWGTKTWSIPTQAYQQSFWFIPMPSPDGWVREDGTYFMQQEMISGVINVTPQESSPNWFPPFIHKVIE